MGGMHGFGPIRPEENSDVFLAPWESRMFAIFLSMIRHRPFGPGGPRMAIENLPPDQYLSATYYERFLIILEQALVERGLLASGELDARTEFFRGDPDAEPTRREDPSLVEAARRLVYTRQSPQRDLAVTPRFTIGDRVRVRNVHPIGHTRLPRYVRGKTGTVDRVHGVHELQDTGWDHPRGQAQTLYTVRFDVSELWGDWAESNETLRIDMWDSYLEPAGHRL